MNCGFLYSLVWITIETLFLILSKYKIELLP